ncbi:restriction endonuclease subunit S [Owenweeksia hongkongensis]|uniref:restriction endonuclease subunit S n=1 Tax=Owenweeksia hongkongensis TaxID=253245 RepID=UPI003A938151
MAKIQNSNIDKKTIEGESSVRLCNYVDVYYNQVIQGEMDFMEASATEDQIQKFKLTKGDVIITKDSESPDDIGIPAYVGESYDNVVCGYHLTMLKPYADIDGKFLYYALSNDLTAGQFKVAANGVTRFGLSQDGIKSVLLPKPDVSTQKKVANFLDKRTSQIDDLIAKKEQLLKLLAEKRTALITQTVTKGLDPTVKMKDSGVEWFKEIPYTWKATRLKFIGKPIIGLTYSPNDISTADSGTLLLRASNIKEGRLDLSDKVYVETEVPSKLALLKDDVLICARSGSAKLVGKAAIVERDGLGTFGAFMTVFRSDFNKFVYYFLASEIFQANVGLFMTTTINQLTSTTLKNLFLAFPGSMDEVDEIVRYLDDQTGRIHEVVLKTKESIRLLKEYRIALITGAVTGKLNLANYDQTS